MATKKGEPDVSTPSDEWEAMEAMRSLPRDLRGGVPRLQELGNKHLWQNARERDADFKRRLRALQLEPFYWSAAELVGGQPFTKEIQFSDDTPREIREVWAKDIDGTGRDLRHAARASCISSVGYGIQYLWPVFFPEDGRPYLRLVPEDAVLDPYEEGGAVRLFMHDVVRDDAHPWLKKKVEQVWVLYDGDPTAGDDARFARWEVYEHEERENAKSPWKDTPEDDPKGEQFFKPLTEIPLVPLYTGSNSPGNQLPWVVMPPLHPLAILNRVWLNKRSDVDYGIHIANVPQRCASGVDDVTIGMIDKVGYKGIWWTEQPQGKFYYLEHSGAAFEVSRLDLGELERRCEVLGGMPNVNRSDVTGHITATGEMRDLSRATTTSQAWALGWQDSYETALRLMARYLTRADAFTVGFNTSFGPKERDLDRAKMIQQDYLNGDLEPEDYYPEMKRLGVYTESFKAEEAARKARARREATMKAFSRLPPPRMPADQDQDQDPEEAEGTGA